MSAITGIFYRDGRSVDIKKINKMNSYLNHRGHDGKREWCEGPVGFGHQMLFTTFESLNEILPFEDHDSGLVITADARIDNRDDLSKKLSIKNNENISDSFFILKAYQKWGENCVKELLGDFAFAIWDKNHDKLFCARDHMGVKQFYYYLSDNAFLFSTEIKALLKMSEVPLKLFEKKIAFYLMLIMENKYTFFENIHSLVPAHYLVIKPNKCKIHCYWKLDPNSKIIFDSDEDYVNKFREIFTEAVRCRLRSAFSIGFELSGGLDSSSIVCMAKNISDNSNDIHTFSYVFKEFSTVDERYYIEKVATDSINSHYIFADNINPLDEIDTILWHQEQPFHTPNIAIIWNLYKKMQENDLRISFCGEGGDAVLMENIFKYFKELSLKSQWFKLIKELFYFSKHENIGFFKLFKNYILFPLIPKPLKDILKPIYLGLHSTSNNDEFVLDTILSHNLMSKSGGIDYLNQLKWGHWSDTDTVAKYHYVSLTSHPYVLDLYDRLTSAFSIETRFPYYDKRLIEFCYAIPTEMKVRYGWSRYIMRIAMNGILPDEIQWRPNKTNFNPIYEKNLLNHDNILEEMIFNDDTFFKGYIDMERLKEIYREYKTGNKGNNPFAIWLSIVMYLWLYKTKIVHKKK